MSGAIPYETFDCVLSMVVDYVKGLSALKLELAWRAQSKLSSSSAQNQTFPHFEITFLNLDFELSLCQVNYFLKSFVGLLFWLQQATEAATARLLLRRPVTSVSAVVVAAVVVAAVVVVVVATAAAEAEAEAATAATVAAAAEEEAAAAEALIGQILPWLN